MKQLDDSEVHMVSHQVCAQDTRNLEKCNGNYSESQSILKRIIINIPCSAYIYFTVLFNVAEFHEFAKLYYFIVEGGHIQQIHVWNFSQKSFTLAKL